MEDNQYCTAAFLDINQAFDKVWHEGLLSKLKTIFLDSIYRILKSYLANTVSSRFFVFEGSGENERKMCENEKSEKTLF
jgi:hypothetical protein